MADLKIVSCDACGRLATKLNTGSSGWWPRKESRGYYGGTTSAGLCTSCATAFRAFMKPKNHQIELDTILKKLDIEQPPKKTVKKTTKKKVVKRKR